MLGEVNTGGQHDQPTGCPRPVKVVDVPVGVDPAMDQNPDNPNNEQGMPGYDASRPTIQPGDPNYQDPQARRQPGR